VVDASHPDLELHVAAVREVLEAIGTTTVPRILVFNKADRVEDMIAVRHTAADHPAWLLTSAKTGEGLDVLERMVAERIERRMVEVVIDASAGDGRLLARLAETGRILDREYEDGRVRVSARIPRKEALRLTKAAERTGAMAVEWPGEEIPAEM
jgi:GTP-binding protein HflX